MTALLIAVVAMGMVAVQPAAATGASTQTTDQAEFGNVTAEVTKETLFTGKVSKVKVTFEAPDGEQVTIDVAGDTETVTATGSEQSVTERVGAFFFFGEHYPVDVSASIQGGESVDGTINEDDGVVTLKSVDGEPEPEDGTISGTVTDDSGNALSGAEVTADGQSATTNASGGYSLTVAPGDYTVEASADGYQSDTQDVTVTEGDTTTADFSLTEEAPDNGTISGTVTDDSGNALSDAEVTADGQSTTTASDGSYSLTAAPGDYTVEATADGYVSDSQPVTVTEGDTTTADFSLTEEVPDNGTISGTVTDDSGNALTNAEVTADGQSATTASDGSYSLTVAPGDYTVEASADGYQSDTQSVTVTEGDTTTADFSLPEVQPDDGTVTGTVTDESGNALSGAEVTAGSQSTTTNASGGYSLTVAPGDYTVEASADGYQSDTQSVTVPEGGSTTADFSLTAEDGTISGVVEDASGNALSDAEVTAGSQSTTTAADGSYTLTVAPGDYTVEANADGYQSDTQQVSVSPGGSATADFSLAAEDGTISGVVEDESGNALSGAEVTAGSQSTTTAADGSYSLTIAPGDYTVEANADGYESDSQDVTVTAGGTTTADFSLPEAQPEYQSFTAWAESGYLLVGNENLQAPLPDCPNGVPENESKGCVKFTADFDPDTGDYTVTPENFEFPPIPFENTTLGTVPANNTATGDITGNLNTSSGEASFTAPIFSYLENPALDDTCGLEVNVDGTTGTSGDLTGSPGPVQDDGTARATLVDGQFSIPEATQENCGFLYTAVNNDVGLPAGAGENEIVQNLYIEFSEETVENNPEAPSNSGS